jgi:hypothetical protein
MSVDTKKPGTKKKIKGQSEVSGTLKKGRDSVPKQSKSALDAIGSEERMAALIAEAEAELAIIEPKIEKLEAQLAQLSDLKVQRQKLLTFRMSLQAINKNYASLDSNALTSQGITNTSNILNTSKSDFNVSNASFSAPISFSKQAHRGDFDASEALRQAKRLVRVSSLNFQLFQALVSNGGVADTPTVKHYLLTQDIRQPGTGENFEAVALTSISSRINYLVRKGLVEADGRGAFVSRFGWSEAVQ